ncbi:electron transporter [Geothermobacter hydrogeniphilus]|uniref:Electron transporter n=1 Tax=Geothermobacter hydrogeniphilus TaxID=1969733 RepID=A0A2K2H7G1_9BACT|nr:(Fe-S)-binding protein [Geothermobacter hydrogeniphilus]PNU19245.1 electron transporter [Geothermobacter hydrogeniphilus]
MELTREIYWNVGHSVMIPMYLLVAAAVGVLVWGLRKRLAIYRQGQPLDRIDQRDERLKGVLRDVLLQVRVLRVKGAGTAHGLFFFGFVLLTIGTTLVFLQADILHPLFGIRFLKGGFYLLFSIVLDLAGLVGIVMLLGLAARRYIVRPKDLPTVSDNALMLVLLLLILVTGFLLEGTRMAATELGTSLSWWSPVGLFCAQAFAGMSEAAQRSLHLGLWWFHFALVLGFFCAIPFTRFRHLLLTPANVFFRDLGPRGNLPTLDLEDEEAESFGVATISDLTWKDIFDGDACTYCKRCQDRCPAWNTDKPLSPMKLVNQINEVSIDNPEANLVETVTNDVLWSCTTCRACQEICPATIEHVTKIVGMRRSLVLMEGEFPGEEVQKAVEQTEVNGNPLGMAPAARADWAEGLEIADFSKGEKAEILYFVGCYASFDKRNQKIARSFIQLLSAAGIKVGILGKEEKCCGEPVRKLGNEYLYQMLAVENIEQLQATGAGRIVTACPHCFNTLAKDYRDLGFELPVEHANTFLAKLLDGGKLKLKAESLDCTYHDSCYLGRYNDLYDAPRRLLAAAGARVAEMEKSRAESFCCGAGGGRILAEEKLGERINQKRARMAAETGTGTLVSSCPFCMTMFEDGIKGAELDETLQPKDLLELLAERIDA